MAGDPTNANIWADANVYVAFDLDAELPADVDTEFGADWELVGLLNGEDGFTETRDEDTTDHYAWGGILVRTTRSKHKRQIRFTPLEDNDAVFALRNPGSTVSSNDGLTTRTVKVPTANPRSFVIQTVDGDVTRRRYIARGEVIEVGDLETSDSKIEAGDLTITVYPDESGVLWVDYSNDLQQIVSV